MAPPYDDEDRAAYEGESSCIDCGAYATPRLGRPTRCRPCEIDHYGSIDEYHSPQTTEGA